MYFSNTIAKPNSLISYDAPQCMQTDLMISHERVSQCKCSATCIVRDAPLNDYMCALIR